MNQNSNTGLGCLDFRFRVFSSKSQVPQQALQTPRRRPWQRPLPSGPRCGVRRARPGRRYPETPAWSARSVRGGARGAPNERWAGGSAASRRFRLRRSIKGLTVTDFIIQNAVTNARQTIQEWGSKPKPAELIWPPKTANFCAERPVTWTAVCVTPQQ